MGVILFTMVTGAMPYLTEAAVSDPLYRLILRSSSEDYWSSWRMIRESNNTRKFKWTTDHDIDEIMPDTTMMEDIREAVTNCLSSFLSSLAVFLTFLLNALKFVVTLGKSRELLDG